MNRLRMKTTATILIAIFMISTLAVAPIMAELLGGFTLGINNLGTSELSDAAKINAKYSVHMTTGPVYPEHDKADEGRIVIPMPSGFTLEDIDTISWWIYTIAGYPAHVDIFLDTNDYVLTAEMASNPPQHVVDIAANLPGKWVETFETNTDEGNDVIDDNTVLHVANLGAGLSDAPSSTLEHWKQGVVDANPHGSNPPSPYPTDPDLTDVITGSSLVLKLEIEVDNWVVQTEAYVDYVEINDKIYDFEPNAASTLTGFGSEPTVSISVNPTSIDFDRIILGKETEYDVINIDNVGETNVHVTAELIDGDGFYEECLLLQGMKVDAFWTDLAQDATWDYTVKLVVPRDAETGEHTATLVFWAEESTV